MAGRANRETTSAGTNGGHLADWEPRPRLKGTRGVSGHHQGEQEARARGGDSGPEGGRGAGTVASRGLARGLEIGPGASLLTLD